MLPVAGDRDRMASKSKPVKSKNGLLLASSEASRSWLRGDGELWSTAVFRYIISSTANVDWAFRTAGTVLSSASSICSGVYSGNINKESHNGSNDADGSRR